MALPQAMSSTTNLVGALQINYALPPRAALQDLGGKVAMLISFMNAAVSAISVLNTEVAALNSAAVSAAGSGVTWSAFSTVPSAVINLTSYTGTFSNFTSN